MTLLVITGGDTSLPGQIVKYLFNEKTLDKLKALCYNKFRK